MDEEAVYQRLRGIMAKCPIPEVGPWIVECMDALDRTMNRRAAIHIAELMVVTEDPRDGIGLINDYLLHLQDQLEADTAEPLTT